MPRYHHERFRVRPRGPHLTGLWTVSPLIPLCVVLSCALVEGFPDSHWQGDDEDAFIAATKRSASAGCEYDTALGKLVHLCLQEHTVDDL